MARARPDERFASVYDETAGRQGLALYGPFYESLVAEAGLASARTLDVACGTGLWARRLASLGFRVTALDRSRPMLELARRRCRGLEVTLLRADMRDLGLEAGFDLVTCTFDSLNYLRTDRELDLALSGFARALRPGGLALFDTNTSAGLRRAWGSQTIVRRGRSATCIWTTRWDGRSRTNTLTMELFLPRAGARGQFERVEEVHRERAHDPEPVCRAARGAGFASALAFDVETREPATARTAKAVFVARTPSLARDG